MEEGADMHHEYDTKGGKALKCITALQRADRDLLYCNNHSRLTNTAIVQTNPFDCLYRHCYKIISDKVKAA